jgi:hypothetical protein
MRDESVRMPDFGPHHPQEKKGWVINPGHLLKRFLMGVIGSCLFSAIMFFVQIKAFVAVILAAILSFLGWGVHPPQVVVDAANDVKVRAEKAVKGHLPGGVSPLHKSPEQIEAEAEADNAKLDRKEHSQLNELRAWADGLGVKYDDHTPLERIRVDVERAEKREKERPERGLLAKRAAAVDMTIVEGMELKLLRSEVKKAEEKFEADKLKDADMLAYERAMERYRDFMANGPNARCPAPKCGHLTRFSAAMSGVN